MRGRTNISGGGTALNGELKEFTVSDGSDIKAGDFVSYAVGAEYNAFMSQNYASPDQPVYIGGNLFLQIINSYLRIVEFDGVSLNIMYTYSDYMVCDFALYDENTVVCVTSSSGMNVAVLAISEGALIEKNILLVSSTADSAFCHVLHGKVVCIRISDNTPYLYCYSITDEGVTLEWENLNLDYSWYYVTPTIDDGDSIYIEAKSSSSSSYYIYICKLSFDETVSSNISISRSTIVSSGSSTLDDAAMSIYNGYVLSFLSYSTYLYSKIYITNTKSMQSAGSVYYSDLGFEDTATATYKLGISGFYDDGKFLLYKEDSIAILQFDSVALNISRVSNIIGDWQYPYFSDAYANGNAIAVLSKSSNSSANAVTYISYVEEKDNVLSGRWESNPVQSYDKDIGALGFAKTSGTAGDTILVYTPKATT